MWVPPSHFPMGLEPRQYLLYGCGEVRLAGKLGTEPRLVVWGRSLTSLAWLHKGMPFSLTKAPPPP